GEAPVLEQIATLQIGEVCIEFGVARLLRATSVEPAEAHFERPGNPLGDLVLDLEEIHEIAIELHGLELSPRLRVDELHQDAQAWTHSLDASRDEIVCAQLTSDLPRVHVLAPKRER